MAKQHGPRFLELVNAARVQIKECTVADVKRRQDAGESMQLIDCREESEYARGHLPGAIHLGKGIIERDVEERFPDPQTELVLYCGGGYRSALAAEALKRMGYENAISMDGGWRGWNDAKYPVVRDNP
ncbi:MAG: sulfurtransferase [Planctomycetaceae bacterium]|nr:sulfurtransferase [Planctomycetaceae bacterium]